MVLRPLFPGNQFITSVADSGLYNKGNWTAKEYKPQDIVYHFSTWWIWTGTSNSTAAIQPGVGSNSWRILGHCAVMTATQITAWTAPVNGDEVFNDTTNRLWIRNDNTWRPAYPYNYHNQYVLGAQTAVNDATARTLLETTPMTYGGLVTVNGTIDIQLAGTIANTEIRVETALLRGGTSIGNLAGMNSRWTFSTTGNYSLQFNWSWDDARPADTVIINVRRQAGTMTWACENASTPWHGVHVIERPL